MAVTRVQLPYMPGTTLRTFGLGPRLRPRHRRAGGGRGALVPRRPGLHALRQLPGARHRPQ